MTCEACEAPLRPGVVFCERCGAPAWGRLAADEAEAWTATDSDQRMLRDVAPHLPPPSPHAKHPASISPEEATGEITIKPGDLALVPSWWVLTRDGSRTQLVAPIVLGRKPTHDGVPADSWLVTLREADLTTSRSHALVQRAGTAVRVTNLSTRAGIPVAWPNGIKYVLEPGGAMEFVSTCELKLGAVSVLLVRE